MLTQQSKRQAQKKLKDISSELKAEEQIKSIIKKRADELTNLINSLKQTPKEQIGFLKQLSNNAISKIIQLEAKTKIISEIEDKMNNDKEKINRQRIRAFQERLNKQASIKQLKQTIQKIRTTVKESIQEEQNKRKKIQDDLEKSLDEIRDKIKLFTQQTQEMEQTNIPLREKVGQTKGKLQGLQIDFKKQAQIKDEENKEQKQSMLEKLKTLEQQMNKITEINKQYSGLQKKNFDSKLNIHLRTQKFSQYSTSFQNSAATIGQCKQQLFKGVQRLNQARQRTQTANKRIKELGEQYLAEFKIQQEKQAKINGIKTQKDIIRGRILELQNKIKEKNQQKLNSK